MGNQSSANDSSNPAEMPAKSISVSGPISEKSLLALLGEEARAARYLRFSGMFVIGIGAFLTLLGYGGVIDWEFQISGVSSKITNASPGIIVLIIGFVLLLFSRIDFKADVIAPKEHDR